MTAEEWRIAFAAGYDHGVDLVGFCVSLEDAVDQLAAQTFREYEAHAAERPADSSEWALHRMGPPESWTLALRPKSSKPKKRPIAK